MGRAAPKAIPRARRIRMNLRRSRIRCHRSGPSGRRSMHRAPHAKPVGRANRVRLRAAGSPGSRESQPSPRSSLHSRERAPRATSAPRRVHIPVRPHAGRLWADSGDAMVGARPVAEVVPPIPVMGPAVPPILKLPGAAPALVFVGARRDGAPRSPVQRAGDQREIRAVIGHFGPLPLPDACLRGEHRRRRNHNTSKSVGRHTGLENARRP